MVFNSTTVVLAISMINHFNFKGTYFTTISRWSWGEVSGVMRVMSGIGVVERILEGRGQKLYLGGGGGDWFARHCEWYPYCIIGEAGLLGQ